MNVRLVRLTKTFGNILALDNFSLEIESGEFMVIVGASGSGKTTLLRVIAGLEQQDSGHVYIGDALVNDLPAGKRNVQMIFQSYALWPHMRVLDDRSYTNVTFPLKVRKWTAEYISGWVRDVARRAGLEEHLFERHPDQLSSGQKQRVALARAMTTSPDVFLMDEPITNLDPPSRVRVRTEIKRLHEELGATTLYVTHNMADAYTMGDRIALMRDGKLVQVGTEAELRAAPADDYVLDFLNS